MKQMKKKKKYDSFIKDILHLATSLKVLEAKARKMGIFLCERELVECKCGFVEDVASDGRLITYKKGDKIEDTGLRFRKTAGKYYVCPVCKSRIMGTAYFTIGNRKKPWRAGI